MNKRKIFVLDTNVLLHSAAALHSFEDNEIVIPMTVLEELDKFKRNQDELGRNARHAIRTIDDLRAKGGSLFEGVRLNNNPDPEKCGILRVVISRGSLGEHVDMSIPDNRIMNVAKMLQTPDGPPVTLVTKDINVRLKADSFQIRVDDFKREQIDYDTLYTGCIETRVSGDLIDRFHEDRSIAVPDGLNIAPNGFVLMQDELNDKHAAFGWCKDGRIEKLPDGVADKIYGITPRSREQRMAFHLLMDPEISLVTLVGKAGSGKTLLALAAALDQTLEKNIYDRILVSRPIVPLGNDIGYLPGDKDDKLDVWMQPIYDNLEFLFHTAGKRSESSARKQIDDLKRSRKLELEAITYIRGRTIPRQFIIVDEAQNLTPHEVKTIISRCGEGTKIVLTGDPDQIDNPYLDASGNGLTFAAERMKALSISGHITLKKSERSPLAAAAAEHL